MNAFSIFFIIFFIKTKLFHKENFEVIKRKIITHFRRMVIKSIYLKNPWTYFEESIIYMPRNHKSCSFLHCILEDIDFQKSSIGKSQFSTIMDTFYKWKTNCSKENLNGNRIVSGHMYCPIKKSLEQHWKRILVESCGCEKRMAVGFFVTCYILVHEWFGACHMCHY